MNRIRRFFTALDDLEAEEWPNVWIAMLYVVVGAMVFCAFMATALAILVTLLATGE